MFFNLDDDIYLKKILIEIIINNKSITDLTGLKTVIYLLNILFHKNFPNKSIMVMITIDSNNATVNEYGATFFDNSILAKLSVVFI
jgi:hypothetical protein